MLRVLITGIDYIADIKRQSNPSSAQIFLVSLQNGVLIQSVQNEQFHDPQRGGLQRPSRVLGGRMDLGVRFTRPDFCGDYCKFSFHHRATTSTHAHFHNHVLPDRSIVRRHDGPVHGVASVLDKVSVSRGYSTDFAVLL